MLHETRINETPVDSFSSLVICFRAHKDDGSQNRKIHTASKDPATKGNKR